jgi:hypothetical protein
MKYLTNKINQFNKWSEERFIRRRELWKDGLEEERDTWDRIESVVDYIFEFFHMFWIPLLLSFGYFIGLYDFSLTTNEIGFDLSVFRG